MFGCITEVDMVSQLFIPKIIHLVCAGKKPPAQFSFLLNRIRLLHQGWEIQVWDDGAALSLINEYFPELSAMYCSYTRPVQRADIFRVVITWLLGGFYMDTDMLFFKSLDPLCSNELVLGIEKIMSPDECTRCNHIHRLRIANYIFGSLPRHPFWLNFLQVAKTKAHTIVRTESDVLESTGPGLLTNVYHDTKDRYAITLVGNDKHACMKSCGPASCNFGDFAAHLHMGSWRWENC